MGLASSAERRTATLRDGRTALVSAFRDEDEPDLLELAQEAAIDDLVTLREATRAGAAMFVARSERGQLIGYTAWAPDGDRAGRLVGFVVPAERGQGLGTLLVRRTVDDACAHGLEQLTVRLHQGSEAIAELLRDVGLATRWQISYPVTRVTIELARTRPGWSTPKAPETSSS
ncbi:MAG: GNAT family N-acetyltransferase [Solirubrobacteraceae bacterium]|jgi:GNAT superfamily N-acetyltransferase